MAAAWGFEVVYNQMFEWARPLKTEDSKKSYYRGIADEQMKIAKAVKAAEESQAKSDEQEAKRAGKENFEERIRQEDAERQAAVDRLNPISFAEEEEDEADTTPGELNPPVEDHSIGQDGASDTASWASDTTFNGFSDDEVLIDDETDECDDHVVEPDFIEDDDDILDVTGNLDDAVRKHFNPAQSSPSLPPEVDAFPSHSPVQETSHSPPVKQYISTSGKAREVPSPLPASGFIRSPDRGVPVPIPGPEASESAVPSDLMEAFESNWESHQQLILWRDTAKQMSEQWLKESGIKLRKGRKRDGTIKDWKAYEQGKKDSRKIDVHRKADAKGMMWQDDVAFREPAAVPISTC